MTINRPPSCMTGKEYVEWRIMDIPAIRHSSRRDIPTDPCDDCTPAFRKASALVGVCDREPRRPTADTAPALRRVAR